MANGSGRTIKLAAITVVVLLAVVVTLQNTSVVTFRFLFWQAGISQVFLIPLVLLLGFVIGILADELIRRQSRRERNGR